MKVCLLSARFPPQCCGVGDYTYFLGSALAGLGNEVHALTGAGPLDEVRYPLPRGFTAHRAIDAWDARRLPPILCTLFDLRPDVLVIEYSPHAFDRRGLTFAANLVPLLARFVPKARVVTNFHELYLPLGGSVPRSLAAVWQRATTLVTAAASHTVCVTAPLWQTLLQGLGVRKRIDVIPVGSNIPRAAVTEHERRRVRSQLLPGGEGVLIAGFGAVHDRDVALLVEGLARLQRERPARLVWIGAGVGARHHLDGIVRAMRQGGVSESDLVWTGTIPHPEVSKLLAASDLMALPFIDGVSTRRSTAMAALEHGLPLVTTRAHEIDDLFRDGDNVCLVPVGDRAGFCETLLRLARDTDLRARISDGARALYQTHFAWGVIARQVARALEAA